MRKFLTCLALILLSPAIHAAEVAWPAKIGDWNDAGPSPRYTAEMNAHLKGDALFQEAGVLNVSGRSYVQGNHKTFLTLYTFHDSSGAYEALTVLRYHVVKELDKEFWRTIYKGNQLLDIESDVNPDTATVDAATKWLQSISDGVAAPPIADYLPSQNRSSLGPELYALGPVAFKSAMESMGQREGSSLVHFVGFESHAEAMLAKFKTAKEEATLLLLDYPTPQLAELHLRHLQRALADAKLTTSSIERKGSLLSIVLAPTSPEYAAKLRAGVNYETQVTWNEASQVATDPPILSTVAKIFIATGVFMVVTVVIGIAFGGVRIITKRLFPGKVFDRKDQIEVLQLGLSGKPIDPSDMY